MRQTLPQRRRAETFAIDSRKTGGDAEAVARDAAVTLSLGPATRRPDRNPSGTPSPAMGSGAPASIIGAVVDAVAGENCSDAQLRPIKHDVVMRAVDGSDCEPTIADAMHGKHRGRQWFHRNKIWRGNENDSGGDDQHDAVC